MNREERRAAAVSWRSRRVFRLWEAKSEEELWEAVRPLANLKAAHIDAVVFGDALAELERDEELATRTEGGVKVYISGRAERDLQLREQAIKIHGTKCSVCSFDFGEVYGTWGAGFIEVHHLLPLGGATSGKRTTNPATDLAVLCANCHRMIHRKTRPVLLLDELRRKFNRSALLAWAQSIDH